MKLAIEQPIQPDYIADNLTLLRTQFLVSIHFQVYLKRIQWCTDLVTVEFDSWKCRVHLCGFCEGTCSYLALFKLISTKGRHTGLDSSSTESYQAQADHGERPTGRKGVSLKCEILKAGTSCFLVSFSRTGAAVSTKKGQQPL